MEIKSDKITLVDIEKLKLNPENNNKHSPEQLKRFVKILKKQGFRNPIVVSNQSGYVVAGHLRIEGAKEIGLKKVPVMYQDFESPEIEYAYLTSDNAIAEWAELDLSAINAKLEDLGPDFDIDLLGIDNFVLEPAEREYKNKEIDTNSFGGDLKHECPKCGFEFND
jgi:ParB-like chromosome segregation protein Spo0J